MHQDRVDQLLKFTLAVAADEDPGNRELGMIHLLKLLYLADLAYAECHQGDTYTGIPWVFYNFGPWDLDTHKEVETVLASLSLTPRRFQSVHFEVRRYSLPPEHRLVGEAEELGRGLPPEVYVAIRRNVHTFGADTETLLHHVYKTLPMLHTSPGQRIDFRNSVIAESSKVAEPMAGNTAPVSKTKAKRKEERRLEMKREIQAKIQARIQKRHDQRVPAPMDAEFMQIQALLNQEDVYEPITLKGKLSFDPSIWTGDFRRECGLS